MFFSKRKAKGTAIPAQHHIGLAAVDGFSDSWEKPSKPPADWKKVLLLTGLGSLSWISTYTGMLELIQANMGEIGLIYKLAIGFAVAMLMLMIIWLLDQLFTRLNGVVRLLFVAGYLFLTLISVGFGFGFYWKFLESRSEATRSAESAVTQVQSALLAAQTRLEQLNTTLSQLTSISAQKAIDEREKGNSCPASRPGDGPRRRMRDADASRFGFAGRFVSERAVSVKQDIAALNGDLVMVMNRHKSTFDPRTGTRNTFLKALGRKLDNSVTRFNAFRTDPQLRQFRADFADRSAKSVFDNGRGGTFSCPDPELQTALRGVVRAIDQLPELEKPKIAAVEGAEAIVEAFRRLTTTLSGLATLKMPPTPDELRAAQQRAVQSVRDVSHQRRFLAQQPGLGERDYIPLFIALFVDFCLLLVSVSRPMQGFQWLEHKMGSAQDGPIIKILSRFRDIHQDEEIRDVFEVFRHVVFDVRGVYYAAIPMNGTDPSSTSDLEPNSAMEAQLLANLFTSFENDKVYRRVVAPLFTTGFIQKKLRTQGSKFHEAESFRLYRFEKDQWQDWMLSAMMGAAKRVEARKRMEGELFATNAPELTASPESPEEDKAPSLDETPDEDNEAVDEAFEKQIASEIEETLFNQTYERQQAVRRREIALDAKVHVLHANGARTPEHIIAQHAGTDEPEPKVVNGAFAPNQTVAPVVPAPPVSPVSPVMASTPVSPPAEAGHTFSAPSASQVAVAGDQRPKTVSLAAKASEAWTAHETGRHKPQRQEQDSQTQAAAQPSRPDAPTLPSPAAAQPPIKTPLTQPIAREHKSMPAIQVHDALPPALRVTAPAPHGPVPPVRQPASVHDVANERTAAPIQRQPQPRPQIVMRPMPPQQPSILAEPTRLPAVLTNANNTGSDRTVPKAEPALRPARSHGPDERREPEFEANGDYDDMIDNITTWFSQDGGSKKRKWTRS